MSSTVPFTIFYAGDAYSTTKKIMGRQSAGKAFMRGVSRTWQKDTIYGIGTDKASAQAMFKQLQAAGFAGQLQWSSLPDWQTAKQCGVLYYPAPPAIDFAAARNLTQPAAFSLMGVTHTLSSSNAMDQVAELILPPFQPWDALICTSQAAKTFVTRMHDEMRGYWQEAIGATRFVDVQLPVIPLGVDVPAFAPQPALRSTARAALELREDETVFLFAGRLSFHAKANPAPVYQALQKVALQKPVVCMEAGVFPNDAIKQAYIAGQKALAPNVRFVWVDGNDEQRYQQAWRGADVFVSLSDNIQETFGLTPVEAMAAGLPVVVSDWDGYKDTVRHGVDGFRIPTVLPPAGVGADLALQHALGLDTYDFYIGRASLATVVEPTALAEAFRQLASNPSLRERMGAAGQARVQVEYDWPVILHRYADLAGQLNQLRQAHVHTKAHPWPQRADPFHRFAHFPTATLGGGWQVAVQPGASERLTQLLTLSMASYALDSKNLTQEALVAVLSAAGKEKQGTVNTVLADAGLATPMGAKALMWLWKFDVLRVNAS